MEICRWCITTHSTHHCSAASCVGHADITAHGSAVVRSCVCRAVPRICGARCTNYLSTRLKQGLSLSSRAVRLLRVLEVQAQFDRRDAYFTISNASRDVLYRKLRDRTMIEGLRFHDLRATALMLRSKWLDEMTLAHTHGRVDTNELFNTYY